MASTRITDAISVLTIVQIGMEKGKRGDDLGTYVLGRIGNYRAQGIPVHWPNGKYYVHYPSGRARGKAASHHSRILIEAYERELEDEGYGEFPGIQAFVPDPDPVDQTAELGPDPGSTVVSAPPNCNNQTNPLNVPLGTSKTLDGKRDWDVTRAGKILRTPAEKLILDLTPLHRSLAKKARQAFTLERSYDDDLIQEARLKVTEGLRSYKGRSAFTTWARTVSWRAMLDCANRIVKGRKAEILGLGDTVALKESANTSDFAETVVQRLWLAPAMQKVPNSNLVFLQALGYADSDLSEDNIRMRRSRAKKELMLLLEDQHLALSA